MNFDHLPQFVITDRNSEEYGDYVTKTAKLVNRTYYQIHRIFEKERWSLEEIKRTYQIATKHHGNIAPDFKWWCERKKRNAP